MEALAKVTLAPADPQGRPPQRVTFRQRPWFPWWVPLAVLAAVAVAIALWALLGSRQTVPDLTGLKPKDAQRMLADDDLLLGVPHSQPAAPGDVPGTIVRQAPKPRADPVEGQPVQVWVAVSPERARVPKATGRPLAEAIEVIERRFEVGRITPSDAEDNWPVVAQDPRRGLRRELRTPVNLEAQAPKTAKPPAPGGGPPPPKSGGAGTGPPADLAFTREGQVLVRRANAKKDIAVSPAGV